MRPQLQPGARIGRYQILGELGQGGMGVVYRAHDQDLGRDVAIKLVTTGDAPTDTLATRLLREAQALAQLSHPNVVAVYDVGRTDGGVFLAMELVAGEAGDVWLRKRPSWRQVLQVFRDAGRGLAAAHAVGLVHRDFKPANLIIGADGRVRVLDFGLARPASLAGGGAAEAPDAAALGDDAPTWDGAGEAPTRPPTPPTPPADVERSSPSSPSRLLDTPLTQAGAIVGTPPYMAPEQHLGGGCDARTDQFSFCVAFYQALYGERPFEGSHYAELSNNIIKGNIKPPPAGSDVPAWLRAVVLRGLAVVPEKRWPSMDAVLEALSRDPDARRRRLLWAGSMAALVAVAGVGAWRGLRDPARACRAGDGELAGVWDTPRREAVRAAFAKTGKPYAAAAFAATARVLDGYTQRWAAMRTDACLATRVRGTQSPELFDLRMACLERRRDAVRAQVDVFAAADGDVVSRAAEAAAHLPALDECADADALRAPVRPPDDAATRARVAAARKALATVDALWLAGRYADARQKLAPVLAALPGIGWRPLEAEARLAEARLADDSGDYPAAARAYRDAAVAAEAGREDEIAAWAANGLVWVTGERLGKYAEAHELARDAQARIERLGHRALLQADLDAKVAALFLEEGKYQEAQERSLRVLAIRQKSMAPDDPAIAHALSDLGDVATQLGHYDQAIDYYRRALAVAKKGVGPDHPINDSLHVNLGSVLRASGRLTEALAELDQARAIIERANGPTHPTLATIAVNTGGVLLEEGHLGEAAAQFHRALDIWQKALGPDHPNVATARYHLGTVALRQGRADEAQRDFQRAYDIWRARLGPEHPSLSAALDGMGDALMAGGHAAQALVDYQQALALLEKALGPKHPDLGEPLLGIGLAELARHAPGRARPPLERALVLARASDDAIQTARTAFALAQALDGAALDPARARALGEEAWGTYRKAGAAHARDAAAVQRWLRRRGG